MEEKIKSGDVVRLKSKELSISSTSRPNEREMTVGEVGGDFGLATCYWGFEGAIMKEKISTAALEKIR